MKSPCVTIAAVCLLFLTSVRAGNAGGFGRTLSDDEVACEESQGHRLLLRTGSDFLPPNLFVWRSAASGGVYRGLVATALLADSSAHQANCTTGRGAALDTIVLVLPPIWPGHETQGPDVLGRAASLKLTFFGDPAMISSAAVNWADLLKDSTWN